MSEIISWNDFEKINIRVGRIVNVEDFPEARNPSYKLTIDFGNEIGLKKSSAHLTQLYSKQELQGKLVLAVINFQPKQIANFLSECLVLGLPSEKGVVLIQPECEVSLGGKLF